MKFQAKYANGEEFTLTATDIDQATEKASAWQETVGASLQDLQPLSSSLIRPLALLDRTELTTIHMALYLADPKVMAFEGEYINNMKKKVMDEINLRDAKK